jgi:hypothetical protein
MELANGMLPHLVGMALCKYTSHHQLAAATPFVACRTLGLHIGLAGRLGNY